MIIFAIIRLQKLELSEYKSCMLKVGKYCNYPTAIFRTLRLQTMHVKNAKKASSKLQRMQTTLSRNYCSINAPKLSAVIHCLQWMTAKIALKLQWEIEHSGNLQNLQGNYLQCGSLILSISSLSFFSFLWIPSMNWSRHTSSVVIFFRSQSLEISTLRSHHWDTDSSSL